MSKHLEYLGDNVTYNDLKKRQKNPNGLEMDVIAGSVYMSIRKTVKDQFQLVYIDLLERISEDYQIDLDELKETYPLDIKVMRKKNVDVAHRCTSQNKKSGLPCQNSRKQGYNYCGVHLRSKDTPADERRSNNNNSTEQDEPLVTVVRRRRADDINEDNYNDNDSNYNDNNYNDDNYNDDNYNDDNDNNDKNNSNDNNDKNNSNDNNDNNDNNNSKDNSKDNSDEKNVKSGLKFKKRIKESSDTGLYRPREETEAEKEIRRKIEEERRQDIAGGGTYKLKEEPSTRKSSTQSSGKPTPSQSKASSRNKTRVTKTGEVVESQNAVDVTQEEIDGEEYIICGNDIYKHPGDFEDMGIDDLKKVGRKISENTYEWY
jgi:hypothetical protein